MSQALQDSSPPVPPPSSPVESPPSKAAVLHLLDAEIALLSQQNLNSGWTSWALAGALGTLLWILLGQWEAGWPKGLLWGFSFISLNYCRIAVRAIFNAFQARMPHQGNVTRFQFGPELWGKQRASSVFYIIQHGAICWGLLQYPLPPLSMWIGLIASGTGVVVMLAMLIVSYTELPTSSSFLGRGPKGFRLLLIQVGFSICAATPAVATGTALIELSPQLAEIKIGALLAAVVFLAEGALNSGTNRATTDNLIMIRRELALGGMSPYDAARHIEIEFLGMRVPDVFKEAAQDFLRESEQIKIECLRMSRQIDSALTSVRQDSSLNLVQRDDIVTTALNAHRQEAGVLVERVKGLHDSLVAIQSKSRHFASASPDAKDAVDAVLITLSTEYGAAHSAFMVLRGGLEELAAWSLRLNS